MELWRSLDQSSSPLTLLTVNWHNCTSIIVTVRLSYLLTSRHRSPIPLLIVSNVYILLWQRCRRMGMILQILLHLEKHGNDSVAWYKSQLPPPNPSLHHPGLVSQKCCTLPPCHLMVYTSQLSPVSPLDVCALFNRPFLSCVLTGYIS